MAVPKTLKKVDQKSKRILVSLMRFFLPNYQAVDKFHGPLNSIVILVQERLGDAILLTPLLKILKQAYPDLIIHLIIFSDEGYFFENDQNINKIFRAKKKYFSYTRKIFSFKYDLLFCTKDHPSFNFLLHNRFIRADLKVGITHPYHKGFFHHLLDIDLNKHIVEKNCALLDFLHIQYRREEIKPYLPSGDISPEVFEFCQQIKGKAIFGINLSAGQLEREWPIEKWHDLISQSDNEFVVLAMPDRYQHKLQLEQSLANVVSSPQTNSIFEAGHIISGLQLLITPDTSLIHVASCFEVPVVALYLKNISLYRFAPFQIPYKRIISKTQSIKDIPVEEVLQGMEELKIEKKLKF